MTGSAEQDNLAQQMKALAMTLQDEDDRAATLDAIVAAAVDLVPGVSWAGISLVQGAKITPEAPSHDVVAEMDQLQSDLGEGPCLTAIREEHTVRVVDLATDRRWPLFATNAMRRGARSMLSMRLFVRREQLGALNLYATEPGAFTPDSEILADLVSQHAAIALAGATHEHHLSAAMTNRDVLGQAKGILMQRDRLTGQQAFALLVRTSQNANMKVAEVARWLIDQTEDRAGNPK